MISMLKKYHGVNINYGISIYDCAITSYLYKFVYIVYCIQVFQYNT